MADRKITDLNYLELPDGWAWRFCYDLFDNATQTKMESKNAIEIYSQLAKGTFLEQDRTSNFPGESIKSWEEYCEASLDLSNQDDVGVDPKEEDKDYKHFKDCLQKIKNLTYEKLVELMGEEWIEDYRQRFPW